MAKFVLVCASVLLLALAVSAASDTPKCGVNEQYYPPYECAPCEVNCGSFKVPCKTRECRHGCQCYLGFKKVNGVCVDAKVCGDLPPGAVN